jgi:hypothetical protein
MPQELLLAAQEPRIRAMQEALGGLFLAHLTDRAAVAVLAALGATEMFLVEMMAGTAVKVLSQT